jgi:LuxR family glucitol operon transcriptional activator
MTYQLARATLYAYLSALESDFRTIIKSEVLCNSTLEQTLPPEQLSQIRKRALDTDIANDDLVDFLDVGDELALLQRCRTKLNPAAQGFFKDNAAALDNLVRIRNRVMHARPLDVDDFPYVSDLVKRVIALPRAVFPALHETASEIRRDTSKVLKFQNITSKARDRIPNNLPIPDFDETGLIGRSVDVANLKKLCASPWPIVSILGEGGIGKTSHAIQLAYDLLDDTTFKFDSIIWSSSKTSQLLPSEIVKISQSVKVSSDLAELIVKELGGSTHADPFQELSAYLTELDIFLIIDNLESILDQRIRLFFRGLTSSRSKIIITSRIGLGELEHPYRVAPLGAKDSIALIRALSRFRGVDALANSSTEILADYAGKMLHNPGFIKWFVSALQYGARPEELLANPRLFLDLHGQHLWLSQTV